MTVVICEKIGNQAYIVSDAVVTRQNCQNDHIETPLGLYVSDQMPPENYYHSFVDMVQKTFAVGNIVIGVAGLVRLVPALFKHISDNIESIKSLDDLHRVLSLKESFIGSEIEICGIIIIDNNPVLFAYNYFSGEWDSDFVWCAIGSGAHIAGRLLKTGGTVHSAEGKLKTIAGLLYGREVFDDEPTLSCIGGVYSGYYFAGEGFCRPSDATYFIWGAEVDGEKQIMRQRAPLFVNVKYEGECVLVRSLWDKEVDGTHVEMINKGPFVIYPITNGLQVDDGRIIAKLETNFDADETIAYSSILYEGVTFDCTMGYGRDNSPFSFSGSYYDHWVSINSDLYLDIIDVAVAYISRRMQHVAEGC